MGDTAYPAANALKKAKNLSDVADAATALSNLGGASSASVVEITDVADGDVYQRSGAGVAGVTLGTAATTDATDYLAAANDLSDLADAPTARGNLGLGTIATAASGDYAATANNLSDLADAPTARGNLGLGALATGADATDVPYTPTTGGDWADPDPVDAAEALDDLASRLTTHEAATVDITDVSDGDVYTRSGAGVAGTTLGDLATGTINDLTAQGTPTGGTDYVVIWDAGLGAHRKVLLNDLPGGGGGGGGEANTLAVEPTATGVDPTGTKSGVELRVKGALGEEGVQVDIDGDDVRSRLDINGMLSESTPDPATDSLAMYDDSASAHRKLPLTNIVMANNSAVGSTTTSTADVDHILVNDGGTLKRITPANLGITNTLATVVAYYAGAGDATDTALTGSTTTAIVYDTEVTDTGGDYDHTTGVFTAPADGIYFYAASLNHSGNTVVRPVIQIDTGGGYSDHAHGTDADQQPDGNTGVVTGVVSLSSGDLVRFAGQNKTATQGRLRGTAFNTQNVTHMSIHQMR